MLDFAQYSIAVNLLVFSAGAVVVWLAGARLSVYVDVFAERTGLGKALAGALLLGGATSLPELATTLTAASSGAGQLAGANLLGGVVMQIAVLAMIDLVVVRGKPLTLFSPESSLLMFGVMLISMVALAGAGVIAGELFSWAAVGFWPVLLIVVYLLNMAVNYRYEGNPRWEPAGEIDQPPESARDLKDAHHAKYADTGTKLISGYFCVAAAMVLLGGHIVAKTGEVVAQQSGVSQGFIGATLVALATSLPEVSTTCSAAKFGAYSMAAANILGTNSLEIALYFPAELAYREGPIFDAMAPTDAFLAMLGVIVTAIYLWGILERRDRTLFGMGVDSFAVLVVYVAGMATYYSLG